MINQFNNRGRIGMIMTLSAVGAFLLPASAGASPSLTMMLTSAEGLATAGVTASDVDAYFDMLDADETVARWCAAAVELEEGASLAAALTAGAWLGGMSPERAEALHSAQTEAARAREDAEALFAACVNAAASWIVDRHGEESGSIFRGVTDRSLSDIPTHFRPADLTEREWNLLRGALLRRDRGESLSSTEAAILHRVESDSVVTLARARISQNVAALEAAITRRISQEQ